MSVRIRQLVKPTDTEIESCTDVLHEAFDQRYFFSKLGQKEDLVRPCVRAHLMSGVIGGEIHVAELPDIGIVGVAMWFGPGQRFLSTAAGWDDVMKAAGDIYSNWWGYFLQFLIDMPNKYYGEGVQLDSYHLQLLGVHPKYQGMGCGTALFNAVEPRAARESRSVVLETMGESSVPFYKSLGYTVFGPDYVESAADEPAFSAYFFQKTPTSSFNESS